MNAVLIRADAGPVIGTGHVMRCLALAGAFQRAGASPVFASRQMFPNLASRIAAGGWRHVALPPAEGDNSDRAADVPYADWLAAGWREDADATVAAAREAGADWIVVDHYGIDRAWQSRVRAAGLKVAALDDLADRAHDADLLVDPSLNAEPYARYAALLPAGRQRLLGPRYAILRDEFRTKPIRTQRDGLVWLIAFGGVDQAGMTLRALQAVATALGPDDRGHIVIGGQNAARPEIEARAAALGLQTHVDTDRMAALMASADLAVGAGGHMLWERAAMALPSIAVIVAENQREQVTEAARAGVVLKLDGQRMSDGDLAAAVLALASDPATRARLATAGRKAVDGQGAARIVRRIAGPPISIRPAEDADCAPMHAWRNDPRVRGGSTNSGAFDFDTHRVWFDRVQADPDRDLLVGEAPDGPLGVVRFDRRGAEAEVSIYLTPPRLGSGLGPNLLLSAEAWLGERRPELQAIVARVLAGNQASEALFLSCGYDRRGADGLFEKPVERRP